MKKLIFLLFGLMLSLAPPIRADEVQYITFQFSLDDFYIEYNGNLVKVLETKGRDTFRQDIPAIPHLYFEYRIAPGYQIKSVTWNIPFTDVVAENVMLVGRADYPLPENPTPELWPAYQYEGSFPSETNKLTWDRSSNPMAFFMYPLEYNPDSRQLLFTPIIEVEVTFTSDNENSLLRNSSLSVGTNSILEKWDPFSYLNSIITWTFCTETMG